MLGRDWGRWVWAGEEGCELGRGKNTEYGGMGVAQVGGVGVAQVGGAILIEAHPVCLDHKRTSKNLSHFLIHSEKSFNGPYMP